MTHVIEPAPTGRAKCRGCGERIVAGELRFGEVLPNPFADGEMTQWFHPACAALKRPEPFVEMLDARAEPLPDGERLRAEAQRGIAHRRLPRINGAERAPTARAQCRQCRATIAKGAWRIGLVFYEEGRFSPAGFLHVTCAQAYFETTDAEEPEVLSRLKHFSRSLKDEDLEELAAALGGNK